VSYRDAETAFRDRAEDLEREIAGLDAEIAEKSLTLDDLLASAAAVRDRIEREGPGGGETGARRLRIPLLTGTLLGLGVAALLFQFFLATFVRAAPREIVPTYLILSAPTILGTAVAYPFRAVLPEFRTGLVVCGILIAMFVLGALGVIHVF
jgi:hypothetical protein